MMMGTSPCKDCSERARACHDMCLRYKAWIVAEHKNKEIFRAWQEAMYAKTEAAEKMQRKAQKDHAQIGQYKRMFYKAK